MKINIAIVISIFVLSTFLLGNSRIAFACTPIYRTTQESLNSADLVFQGKVISTATSTQVFVYDGTSVLTKMSTMDFKVEKFWKGNPTERVTVKSTAPDGYSCPVFIPKTAGTEYLVYANKDINSNSYFVRYTEIKEVSLATVDLNLLGNSKTLNVVVKTNVSVAPTKTNPTPNVITKPAEKKVTSTNAHANSQSDTVEAQSDVKIEVKPNFIQKILLWLGNFFK